MATKQSSSAKYLKECPVCLDDMVNKTPKLLDCKHSFCISCISGLAVAHGAVGLKVPCPKCKHDTDVKSGRLSDLPDNFLLQEFKAALDDHMRHRICSYCHKLDKETDAVSECINCHKFMCNGCTQKHKEYFSSHEIVLMVDGKPQELCKTHDEAVVYVCRVCSPSRILCDVCIMTDGPCHTKESLVDYTQVLSEEEAKLKSKLDQQDKVHEVFTQWKDKVKTDISSIIDPLTTKVTSRIESYSNIKAMEFAAEKVKQEGINAQKLLKSDTRQLANMQEANKLLTKALTDFDKEGKKAKVFGTDVELKSKTKKALEKVLDLILPVGPRLRAGFPITGSVSRMRASIEGRVFFCCKGDKAIKEITPDGQMRQILTNHSSSRDVSFDMHENCIFFSCYHLSCRNIYKCEFSPNYLPSSSDLKPIYTSEFVNTVDFCITENNNIVMFRPYGDASRYNLISGEVKVYKIPYKDEYIQLTSVKCDDRPGFIATYTSHKTLLYHDEDGKVVHTLCEGGSPVCEPKATAISVTGNILVADSGAGKIVELTLQGEFVRDVLTRDDGLHKPVNVVYSHPYLWVADQIDHHNGCLKCFEV